MPVGGVAFICSRESCLRGATQAPKHLSLFHSIDVDIYSLDAVCDENSSRVTPAAAHSVFSEGKEEIPAGNAVKHQYFGGFLPNEQHTAALKSSQLRFINNLEFVIAASMQR